VCVFVVLGVAMCVSGVGTMCGSDWITMCIYFELEFFCFDLNLWCCSSIIGSICVYLFV